MPRNLAGQFALLVAITLFVAQAINFAMLLHERRAFRYAQITGPLVALVVDASERASRGAPLTGDRRRNWLILLPSNPVPEGMPGAEEVERGIAAGLAEDGYKLGRIVTAIRPPPPPPPHAGDSATDPHRMRLSKARLERIRRVGGEVIVAVEVPGRGWVTARAPWPRGDFSLIWQLLVQTLVLYVCTLVPILIVGRRISLPLRDLARSARGFTPGGAMDRVEERGPGDVRAVISAYNGLSERVGAMLDEKDRMLGAIGHDLRTPLAALRVRIESVEDEGDRARMAETIDEMNTTLDDILSLARIGRPSEPATDVDLAALVDAVVADFDDIGADVTLEEAPRLPMRLRPTLMRRAVRNLIENAVKYGGSAEVRLVQEADAVAITIADHGPGIAEDKIAHVFEAFIRLDESRNRHTGGVGLGLALARAIVREAGGTLTLANRAGGGLVATIRLPRTAARP